MKLAKPRVTRCNYNAEPKNMSQDNNPDDQGVMVEDMPEGIVEDYHVSEDEPTGAQGTDDSEPQIADVTTDDGTDEADEAEESEPEAEENPESQEEPEAEEDDKAAKMQHAIKAQAYENRELKRRLKELEAGRQEPQAAETQPKDKSGAPKLPKMEDPGIEFDEDKYEKAVEQYHRDAAKYWREEEAKKAEQAKAQDAHQKKVNSFIDATNALQANDPAYAEMVNATQYVRFSDAVTDALLNSENPGELHRALISDPDNMDRINSLPAYSALREMIALEGGLKAPAPTPAPKKKVTEAPPPVSVTAKASSPAPGVPAGYKEDY